MTDLFFLFVSSSKYESVTISNDCERQHESQAKARYPQNGLVVNAVIKYSRACKQYGRDPN